MKNKYERKLSTYLYNQYSKTITGGKRLKKAGFKNVMLNIGVSFPAKDDTHEMAEERKRYGPDSIRERYSAFVKICKDMSIQIPIAYAPYTIVEDDGLEVPEMLVRSVLESMKFCKQTNCKNI